MDLFDLAIEFVCLKERLDRKYFQRLIIQSIPFISEECKLSGPRITLVAWDEV